MWAARMLHVRWHRHTGHQHDARDVDVLRIDLSRRQWPYEFCRPVHGVKESVYTRRQGDEVIVRPRQEELEWGHFLSRKHSSRKERAEKQSGKKSGKERKSGRGRSKRRDSERRDSERVSEKVEHVCAYESEREGESTHGFERAIGETGARPYEIERETKARGSLCGCVRERGGEREEKKTE